MSVLIKKTIIFVLDFLTATAGYYFAKSMFLGEIIFYSSNHEILIQDLTLIILAFSVVYLTFKVNSFSWCQSSVFEALVIFLVYFLTFCVLIIFIKADVLNQYSIRSVFVGTVLSAFISECLRFAYRAYLVIRFKFDQNESSKKKVLIYGAGQAGLMLVREIIQNKNYDYKIVGFIDDYVTKKGNNYYGFPVLGNGNELDKIIAKYSVNKIIVAMPSLSNDDKSDLIQKVIDTKVPNIKVLSNSIIKDPSDINKSLRNVEIKDLLNRKEITFNDDEIETIIKGKKIFVTGSGGSIGSELVRQIIKYEPRELTLIDINETGLYHIEQEINIGIRLGKISKDIKLNVLIASIRDSHRMEALFNDYQPEILFHAAAHKHVPLMESSPKEAIKNNIFGTKNLIDLSIKYNLSKFINISTDKAVNPTNVMGATKRFIEMMLQNAASKQSNTIFCAVRFGNVLGSNGSVIPLFKEQIEKGGPVTVTHPEMVRYFMTIPEAVSLVLQAATYASGGEIFVLDMGEPVKISDLAYNLIKLSGLEPNVDIKIEYTGLRPGEKLYEELLMAEEGLRKTPNDLIYIANPMKIDDKKIVDGLSKLNDSLNYSDKTKIKMVINEVVPTYRMES